MIDKKNFFNQPVKSDLRSYDNIWKIVICQGDYYFYYNYFKNYCKMIAIDVCKKQPPHVDPKAIQQINFAGNIDQAESATIFFVIEKEE